MKYAYFDPTTSRVVQWFDTEAFDCNLPDPSMLVEVENIPQEGDWYVANGRVTQKVPAPAAKSPEQIAGDNRVKRDILLSDAATRIAPLQDAVDLGVATPDETSALTAWKGYRVALLRIDLSLRDVSWPTTP